MLYCPQCGTEYREGYSSCSDCHVLLMRERPRAATRDSSRQDRPADSDSNRGPYTPFWSGDDSRLHGELCSLLDEAEIPHMTIRKEDRLFRVTTQPFFELVVPVSQMEKAESVIRDAFGEMPQLPDPDARPEGESGDEPSEDSEKFVRSWAKKGLLLALLEKLREPRPQAEETNEIPRRGSEDWFKTPRWKCGPGLTKRSRK